jgi:hypothetical protein
MPGTSDSSELPGSASGADAVPSGEAPSSGPLAASPELPQWVVEYIAEHKACVRRRPGKQVIDEGWSTWTTPGEEANVTDAMVAVWPDGFTWACADYLVGDFKGHEPVTVTRATQKKEAAPPLMEGTGQGWKVKVTVKPEAGTPLTVISVKPLEGTGSWSQKCQCTTKSCNGDISLAGEILTAVAHRFVSGQIMLKDLKEARDETLAEAGLAKLTKSLTSNV